MEFIWKKWLHKYVPYEACSSVLDLIQYCTERRWNATIRIKMVLPDHSRGFGIYIDKKPANPMDLYYTKNLKLDTVTVILRGPIPTYNGETFFVPWLMSLEARKGG